MSKHPYSSDVTIMSYPNYPSHEVFVLLTTLEGAIIKEQGVTFAIVNVKQLIIQNNNEADDLIEALSLVFDGLPVILMSQNNRSSPRYYGKPYLSEFLINRVYNSQIPWRRYTVDL